MSYNPEADEENLLPNNYFQAHHLVLFFASIMIVIFLQTLSLIFSIRNGSVLHKPKDYMAWKDSGNSSSEARDYGCIFDVMMTGWVKEDCYNSALSEQYLLEGGYKFFSDQEETKEIPMDVIRLGEHTNMWTNDLHCKSHHHHQTRFRCR